MPRIISMVKKREWLKAYEEGQSQAWIASKDNRDTRTVKKGIGEARLERDASLARAELIKEALHKHNEALLEITRGLLSIIKPPSPDQTIPWKSQPSSGSIRIEGGNVPYEHWPELKVMDVTLDEERKAEWELLKEHLKLDPMWRLLSQWKKVLATHLEARIVMSLKLADLLKEKTGYQLADRPVDGPFVYSDSVDSLSPRMIARSQKLIDTDTLKRSIIADPDMRGVTCGGVILAHTPGREEECRKNILEALSELEVSQEMMSIKETYQVTEDLAAKARRAAQELLMLGLVPGQCRVCQRLGR